MMQAAQGGLAKRAGRWQFQTHAVEFITVNFDLYSSFQGPVKWSSRPDRVRFRPRPPVLLSLLALLGVQLARVLVSFPSFDSHSAFENQPRPP